VKLKQIVNFDSQMKDYRKKHSLSLFKSSILFIIAGLVILFLFPKETQFRFEFTKGKPWHHKTLIAPFSFAIKKLPEQIQAEKDTLIKKQYPYFDYNKDTYLKNVEKLNKDYLKEINNEQISQLFNTALKKIYQYYIISPITLDQLKQNKIYVLKNKEAIPVNIRTLYTPKRAVIKINNTLTNPDLISLFSEEEKEQIQNIPIQNYINNNIAYDENITQKLLQQKLDNISLSKGMVQKGELIISKGEIVNNQTFAALNSFKTEFRQRYSATHSSQLIIGNIILISIPLSLLFFFLLQHRKKLFLDLRKLSFILSTILLFTFFVYEMQKFNLSIYILPITILPILIRSFFDSRVAIFTFVTSLLIFSFLVPNSYEFMFMQMIAGIFAIFSLQNITRRSNLFNTSIVVLVVYILTYTGISLIQENELQKIQWINFAWLALNSILIMFSYPLVFFFEKIFHFSSNLTLLELADINRPLLKQMSKIAPGTFQHSIQVANIAEELIQRIGGNALLVRAGALYHDIGKMESPEYFTENQRKGFNPHDNLTCEESAKILIGHISKGVALAKKNNLPRAIINFIEMHHGITQTRFFTAKFKAKYPDKEIDLSLFTYPGPKPISKETAAVMIADSVEAASRSLQDHSRENLKKLIDSILDYQIKENQFEFVNITFKEMTYIKSILLERLSIIYHTRIAYPEEK